MSLTPEQLSWQAKGWLNPDGTFNWNSWLSQAGATPLEVNPRIWGADTAPATQTPPESEEPTSGSSLSAFDASSSAWDTWRKPDGSVEWGAVGANPMQVNPLFWADSPPSPEPGFDAPSSPMGKINLTEDGKFILDFKNSTKFNDILFDASWPTALKFNGEDVYYFPKSFVERGHLKGEIEYNNPKSGGWVQSNGNSMWQGSLAFLQEETYQFLKPTVLSDEFRQYVEEIPKKHSYYNEITSNPNRAEVYLNQIQDYGNGYIIEKEKYNEILKNNNISSAVTLKNPPRAPDGISMVNGKPAYVGMTQDTSGSSQRYDVMTIGQNGQSNYEFKWSKSPLNVPILRFADTALRIIYPMYNLARAGIDLATGQGSVGDVALALIAANIPNAEGVSAAQGTFFDIPQIAKAADTIADFYQLEIGFDAAQAATAARATVDVGIGLISNGMDIESALKNAAAAYVGRAAAGEVAKLVSPMGSAAQRITAATTSATTRALLLNKDPEKAAKAAFISTSIPLAVDGALESSGFKLPDSAKNLITSAALQKALNPDADFSSILKNAAFATVSEAAFEHVSGELVKSGLVKKTDTEALAVARESVNKLLAGYKPGDVLTDAMADMLLASTNKSINNWSAQKEGWSGIDQKRSAQELYGSKVTPDQFADKQNTTEAEAKQIARDILGREPTEFEYMQLIGLPEREAAQNSDLSAIRYDESTFDSNELAEAYKAVYGREPTKEFLESPEAFDMLGRSEAQGKNLLNEFYTKDKNWVTEEEAQQFWRDAGNKGEMPQDLMDNMLVSSEAGSRAMAETYRIRAEDTAATTFDGSKYDTAAEAKDAAIKAGYNSFTDPVSGKTQIIMPENESLKRSQLIRQVLDGQGLTPTTATAEQRQEAINLVSGIPQNKLDSTNVVDLMADAGIAGGSYVKQESNLKYYLTAPPAPSAPKAFDGTRYSTQTDAAIAAASRGQNTFAWTDGKTYKVPTQIAEDGKSGALRDKSFAGDLVSLANAYARGEISNKEYEFLEVGIKKQAEAVNKLIINRDLKSAQEAAGQTVGWANLGVETKETISMLDRAADRVLSLGEGVGNLVASIGQTIAAMTVNPQGEGDMYTGFTEGVPKMWMDPNNNSVTNTGNNISEFFSSRYSDQAKDERKKITNEIKRPGATEASVTAVVLNNLHGYSTFTGAELAEEVIPFLAGGGIGAALKLGKAGLVAITGSAATIADMSEVYGPTYSRVQREAIKQGDNEATAHAKASQAASGNALITLATEGPLNFMLAKSLLVGSVKNAAYTVGGNIAAQMAGEYIESMAHNINEDFVLTGKAPVLADLNKYRGQATFEALVAGGTTSGMYVLAAANPNKIIGKDYDGNDFTVADAITKPSQFNAKTLDSSAMVTDPITGKAGSFLDVFGDATTRYAGGYSTQITESVVSKNPSQSLQIMQDMGLANWTTSGVVTFSPDAGNIAAAFISSNTVLPQSNGTYAPTFDVMTLPDVKAAHDYVSNLLEDIGYKPTDQEVKQLVSQNPDVQKISSEQIAEYVDPRMVDEQEVKDAYAALGLNKPTQEDILKLVGQYDETGLTGKATENLDAAKYNSIMEQIEQLSAKPGIDPAVLETIKNDINSQITVLGGDVSKLQSGLDSIVSSQQQTQNQITDLKNSLSAEIQAAKDIGLEGDAAIQAGLDSLAAKVGTNQAGLLTQLGTTAADLRTQFAADIATSQTATAQEIAATKTALEAAIADAKASGLEGDAALKSAIDAVASDQQTNAADLLTKLGTTEAALKAEFEAGLAGVSTEIADTRKALEDAIQAAKDIGLEGDAALQAGIESLAADLGTTKESLLTQLGTTEETLRTEFATGITGLETQMKAQYDALTVEQKALADALTDQGTTLADAIAAAKAETSGQISELEATTRAQYESLTAAQKAAADALVAQGQTLQDAIAAAKTETAGQIADVETRLTDAIAAAEAMGLSRDQAITAAVESVAADLGTTKADLLTQLGTTEQALRTEFTTGLAGVSAEVKAAYDSLTADQKALADQLAQQGVDLTTAIQTAQAQTQGQIGTLTADVQAKYDALTAEQKALANQLQQQGVDLNTAIETAQQQTQQQITNLGVEVDARINQLMQQGQTYQQATQQAFAEVNAKNQEMAGLIGTQGRTANQQDIDALNQMLSGQRSMDLAYDVTGDKQITQADIDFLTQVVGGVKTDWTAPQQSPWAATGLYGQIQANELQRQRDLASSELQRQADQQAAAEEARRGNIRSTLSQGQQQLQGIQQQLPQAFKQAQEVSTPIYGQMGPYLDIGSELDYGFFKPSPEKQAGTKQQQPTKIAAGGYIDDLLAGDMTADDLLNLLR